MVYNLSTLVYALAKLDPIRLQRSLAQWVHDDENPELEKKIQNQVISRSSQGQTFKIILQQSYGYHRKPEGMYFKNL